MTIVWLIVAIVFFVGEMICPIFFMFWFAIGALLALVTSLITSNLIAQLVVFLVTSLIFCIFIKPLTKGIFKNHANDEFNVNGVIGKKAIVIEEINNLKNSGKIKINGEVWKAITENENIIIPIETQVHIIKVDGVKLIVKNVDNIEVH